MLCTRLDFTKGLRRLHRRTLDEHSDLIASDDEVAAHEAWTQEQAERPKKRKPEPIRMPCPACMQAFAARDAQL